jgi:hypothetical protein
MSHPTIGPNATRLGAIALYNRLFDLALYADWPNTGPDAITVDRIDSIPDTKRGAVGIYHCDGRQYIVSVMPMPGARSAVEDYPPCPDCGHTADQTTPCLCPPRPRGDVADALPF